MIKSYIQTLLVFCFFSVSIPRTAQARGACPSFFEPAECMRFVHQYKDKRSLLEKSLNAIGKTDLRIGRSVAVIAGASNYPNLSKSQRHLEPAAADLEKLRKHLIDNEYFDEVLVLWNSDMNLENLDRILQGYLPVQLKRFPRARFLFVYSGHGFSDEEGRSYLLKTRAQSLHDKSNAVRLSILRQLIDEVVDVAHHTLVLINSCYGGEFLARKAFGEQFLPRHPGAHAITAGGRDELTWHLAEIGSGSIFFEKVLAALDGRADTLPPGGDGIVLAYELFTYLNREIGVLTNQKQNPKIGDISRHGSKGQFFFLDQEWHAKHLATDHRTSSEGLSMGESPIEGEPAPDLFAEENFSDTAIKLPLGTIGDVGVLVASTAVLLRYPDLRKTFNQAHSRSLRAIKSIDKFNGRKLRNTDDWKIVFDAFAELQTARSDYLDALAKKISSRKISVEALHNTQVMTEARRNLRSASTEYNTELLEFKGIKEQIYSQESIIRSGEMPIIDWLGEREAMWKIELKRTILLLLRAQTEEAGSWTILQRRIAMIEQALMTSTKELETAATHNWIYLDGLEKDASTEKNILILAENDLISNQLLQQVTERRERLLRQAYEELQ